MRRRGFTIVELLIVIVVIAVLASVAVVAYNGVKGRAEESLIKADMSYNIKRFELYNAEYGHYPSSLELANAPLTTVDYKLRASKRSAYAFFSYCTGGAGNSEIIIAVGSVSRKMWYVSNRNNQIVDVSADFDASSSIAAVDMKCFDYLQNTSQLGEWRYPIRRTGGVETGYINITNH